MPSNNQQKKRHLHEECVLGYQPQYNRLLFQLALPKVKIA